MAPECPGPSGAGRVLGPGAGFGHTPGPRSLLGVGREGQTSVWGALGNLGLLPGQWQFRAGEQRTSPALPAGAEHSALQSWELLWPLLAPSHWPRDHLLWGGNISAPLGLSGRCGFGGSKGLNKEMLFLVLRKFIKSIYGAGSCGWEISCGRRGWILWGCFGAPVCLGGVLG